VKNIISSSLEQLSLIPGLGETKVKRLHETFNRPFCAALQQQRRAAEPSTKSNPSNISPISSVAVSSATDADESAYSKRISDL
jgi:hypothetical protein